MAKKATPTPRTRKSSAPDEETKADAFSRLASARLSNAVGHIKNLGKLANKNNYEYEPAQVKKIFDILTEETETLKNLFETGGSKSAKAGIKI